MFKASPLYDYSCFSVGRNRCLYMAPNANACSDPRVLTPERFLGERSKFRAFCNACELYFALQPRTFSLEATKVGFVISLLQGEPQAWAHRLLEQKATSLTDLAMFFNAMAQLYEDPQQTATAEAALHNLQQGCRVAEDYVSEFRRWSSDTNWNDAALRYQFHMGLSGPLKDKLARVEVPLSLDVFINSSIQIDQRLRERRSERTTVLSSMDVTTGSEFLQLCFPSACSTHS